MYRSGKRPPKPELPLYADLVYWISFILSIYFKDQLIIHGFLSCLPIFMIVYLILNRITRGELGSSVIMLSLLAESIAHLFHQFAHDEKFKNLYFFEHLICAMFLAMGNFIYVFEKREKKDIFRTKKPAFRSKLPSPQTIIIFPIIASGFYLLLYETRNDDSNWILYYMKVLYSIPLTIQLIFAIQRYKTTSKKSYYFGLTASIVYVLTDLIQEHNPLMHKLLHRISMYLQTQQILSHIQWFTKNKYKFE